MTREEAIESIKSIIDVYKILVEKQINSDVPLDNEDIQALEMAISALEKNESAEEWYKLICEKWDSAEGEYIKKSDVLEEFKVSGTFYRKRADKYKDTDVERASVAKAVANVYKYLTLFVSDLPAISIHNKAESEDDG